MIATSYAFVRKLRTGKRCRLRRVVVPFVDGKILVDGNGDDSGILDVRMRVTGDVCHG